MARFVSGTPLVLVQQDDVGGAPPLACDEEAQAAKLAHPKRRAEWIMGRLAAKEALAQVSGARPEEISVVAGPDGAPCGKVGSRPLPHGISISHGHGQAVAWALERGLPGVDLERVKPRPEGTFRFYLEPREREVLGSLEGEERDAAAVVLWSLKEAAWKTLRPHRGVGLLDFALGSLAGFEDGGTEAEPRGPALELARTLGIERIEARFVRRGELVYSWARAVSRGGAAASTA